MNMHEVQRVSSACIARGGSSPNVRFTSEPRISCEPSEAMLSALRAMLSALRNQVSLKDGILNQEISLKIVVLRVSSLMTTIHLYGLDPTALAGPHSKSLPHLIKIAHVC